MYIIITIKTEKQDPVELGIWVNELKAKGWHFNENLEGTCWKKSDNLNADKEEFDSAIVMADLVKDYYILCYAEKAPIIELF